MLSVVNNDEAGAEGRLGLDEICREGARTMLAAALEAEVDAYLAEFVDERDEDGVNADRKGERAPVSSAKPTAETSLAIIPVPPCAMAWSARTARRRCWPVRAPARRSSAPRRARGAARSPLPRSEVWRFADGGSCS